MEQIKAFQKQEETDEEITGRMEHGALKPNLEEP